MTTLESAPQLRLYVGARPLALHKKLLPYDYDRSSHSSDPAMSFTRRRILRSVDKNRSRYGRLANRSHVQQTARIYSSSNKEEDMLPSRSEERRVGKECGGRRALWQY